MAITVLEIYHFGGSTEFGRLGTQHLEVGTCEAVGKKMGVTREGRGQENVAPRELSILWPSKGTGQMGMSRKECGKSHSVRMQGSCRVFGRKKKEVSSTSVTEIGERNVGPK